MLSRHAVSQHGFPTEAASANSSSRARSISSRHVLTCVLAYQPDRQGYTPIPFNQQQQRQQQQEELLRQQQQQQQWPPPTPWQQQAQQQRQRMQWQQQQQQQPAAAAPARQGPDPQQQQQRQRRGRQLLDQRSQQEQQQQQRRQQLGSRSSSPSSEEDTWFVEQPLGTWGQPGGTNLWRQQQQQQQMTEAQRREEQQLEQQLLDWLDQGADGFDRGLPVRLVSREFGPGKAAAWFHARQYLKPQALHAEIMARSGRGQLEVAALTHLIRTSCTPKDAALALSAVSAVRHVGIAKGRVDPWPDSFLKAFIKMSTICNSHEVLVSAMQRPNELGFVFKHKSFNLALKHWGSRLELHKLEQILLVAATAGLQPDARMAYALVRACVNAQQWGKLEQVLGWFRAQGVTQYKPAMEKLLQQAAAAREADAAAREADVGGGVAVVGAGAVPAGVGSSGEE